jgi:demethylmenaquinone methyltransferase/2-methoxy-6-polyprenyl-1,4-benzoquinol methylase
VFFIDNLPSPTSTALDHRLGLSGVEERRLNDGRMFRIVKMFHDPEELKSRLGKLGWALDVNKTHTFFIYGSATSVV